MSKVYLNYNIVGVVALLFFSIPQIIFAAELKFKVIPNTDSKDKATLVEINIDPQSKKLNVVEGEIKFAGAGSENLFVQVENGQSILPIWPTPPQYDKDKKTISFTGGVPGGFDKEGLLFRLRLSPSVSGMVNISYINGNAYLNDGKGTKESVSSEPFDINIDINKQNQKDEKGFTSNKNKYAIIILSVVFVLVIILKYVFKKNNEK